MNSQRAVNSQRALAIARWLYDEVHIALWAIAIVFVFYFIVFIAPKLPEARIRAEAVRAEAINAEDEGYCARWHMGPGTPMHNQCILDLGQYRKSIENHLADENGF
jgi:hypothetical protein